MTEKSLQFLVGARGLRHLTLLVSVALLSAAGCTSQDEAQTIQAPAAGSLLGLSEGGDDLVTRSVSSAHSYPLMAAPSVFVEDQKLVASDGAPMGRFGTSVSMSGDTILVGARGAGGDDTGAAYVFTRNAQGWLEQQKLVAADAASGASFGVSVAVRDDTALVGAFGDKEQGTFAGAAYVFVRSAGVWSQQSKFSGADTTTSDFFGGAVSLGIDLALVGATGSDGAQVDTGAAYAFVRSADAWSQDAKILAPANAWSGHAFGASVSLDGTSALIGSPGHDSSAQDSGIAYLFTRGTLEWSNAAWLEPGTRQAQRRFGHSVSLDGTAAMIGAIGDNGAGDRAGAMYAFTRNSSIWAEANRLVASDTAAMDAFGWSVSVRGETTLVGAPGGVQDAIASGAAYVFSRSAGSFSETQKLVWDAPLAGETLGAAVALDDATGVVGAFGDGPQGARAGSARVVALRLIQGQICSGAGDCVSGQCVDGHCCDSACDGPCEACGLLGFEGLCSPIPQGSAPSPACGGFLCDGALRACPTQCSEQGACKTDHYCDSSKACAPKAADGTGCTLGDGCASGHCVDKVCCEEACADGCGSCALAGAEGQCASVAQEHAGTPSCAPYVCTGMSTGCPTDCLSQNDCAPDYHCAAGACEADGAPGARCSSGVTCTTEHCTDGVCCLAESCGAYRCGDDGVCEAECGSNAQCALGYQCTSAGNCEPQSQAANDVADGGACHLGVGPSPAGGPSRGFGLLLALVGAGVGGRRWRRSARRSHHPRPADVPREHPERDGP